MGAMFQERTQEFSGFRGRRACAVRPAYTSIWQRAQNGVHGKIVELGIFLWRSFPISDIRLIPDLPQPRLHFGIAIPLAQMAHKVKNQFRPFLVILWRIGPSGKEFAVREIVAIWLWMGRKSFGHESDFD